VSGDLGSLITGVSYVGILFFSMPIILKINRSNKIR